MTKEKRLQQIKKEIKKLQEEQIKIETELLKNEDLSFKEKLKIWLDSDSKIKHPYLFRQTEFPHLGRYFRNEDLDRHETYELAEHFEDLIDYFLETDEDKYEITEEYNEKAIKLCLEEAIEKNIGSFKCDW